MVRDRDVAEDACKAGRALAAALLTLALAGCASDREGRGVSLVGAVPEAAGAVEGRVDTVLRGEAGESIALSRWPAIGPARGAILAVHGFGDYGLSTYGEAAEEWRARGLEVFAYDQRGFGRNPSNGAWPGADRLVEDLALVHALVRAETGGLPLTVVGHSMGGAVVAAALGEGRIEPERAVLLAPALWGGDNLGLGYRALAGVAVTLFPDRRWSGDGVVRIRATDNIEALRKLGRDPLYVRKPSSREFAGLIAVMDRAVAAAPLVDEPVLTIYGARDEVVPEEPVRAVAATFAGPSEFRLVETGWHLLLRDLEGARVRGMVADYALSGSAAASMTTKARTPGER